MKICVTLLFALIALGAKAQKIDSIFFNLYTDSLKVGVHNYISVDAKMSDGTYFPLTSNEVVFTSSGGKWEGNSIIIDSAFANDSVVIYVALKDKPEIKKNITIYIKKLRVEDALKTEQELLDEWRKKKRNKQ